MTRTILAATASILLASTAAAVPYDQYILAPSSRQLYPESIYKVNGTVDNAASVATGSNVLGSAVFKDKSAVTFDFEKNIAGLVTLEIGDLSSTDQYIGITFSESSLWISGKSSDATADEGDDEVLWFQPTEAGTYTVSREHERGGFRYLSLVHNTTGSLEVTQVEVYFTAVPHWADDALRDYTGWFNSDDEQINRIWYAGAYTDQLCTIDPTHGNSLIHLGETDLDTNSTVTWYNNGTIANGTSVLVDGAKRDRLVWPGDMAISLPATAVSTFDLISARNGLDSLFILQTSAGALPYAGTPFFQFIQAAYAGYAWSYTYHLHALNSVWAYYLYTGDMDWILGKWGQYKFAMEYSLSFLDDSGLANVTYPADWGRNGMGAHNIEANSILYFALQNSITLAMLLNDTSVIQNYTSAAVGIKAGANALLWSEELGLYTDNQTTTLAPQDGNSWALIANIPETVEQAQAISTSLRARWGPYGAPAVEAYGTTISPFVGGFELQAHLSVFKYSSSTNGTTSNATSYATNALDLMRLQWGDFMLDNPYMTNSTFIEGYSTNGALHYPPYADDQRVSYAHGWSTGPTVALSTLVAGIKIVTPQGQTWSIEPQLGDLTTLDAGLSTALGVFSVKVGVKANKGFEMSVSTPEGTSGMVVLGAELQSTCSNSRGKVSVRGADGKKACGDVKTTGTGEAVEIVLDGGDYEVVYTC